MNLFDKICYEHDIDEIKICGYHHSNEQMRYILDNHVFKEIKDIHKTEELIKLSMASDLDFNLDEIRKILTVNITIEESLVGEFYAQYCIKEMIGAKFPTNIVRDFKNPNSSLPGIDIIGFSQLDGEYSFLFCEVKTSSDRNYPPQVVYGKRGLQGQLEEIIENHNNKLYTVIRYIAVRLENTSEWDLFQRALHTYYNTKKISIIGCLVRDVEPNDKDLVNRGISLAKSKMKEQKLSLFSIYLPVNSISKLTSLLNEEKGD